MVVDVPEYSHIYIFSGDSAAGRDSGREWQEEDKRQTPITEQCKRISGHVEISAPSLIACSQIGRSCLLLREHGAAFTRYHSSTT